MAALDIRWDVIEGDCLEVLRGLPDNSVEALITDPPAGISFMNKTWDDDKGGRDAWIAYMAERFRECLRILKPGAHGFVWALPRTSHWTGMALENAGFEVREKIVHLFGSGFPKNLDVAKALDKAAGVEREVVGTVAGMGKQNPEWNGTAQGRAENSFKPEYVLTVPTSDEAQKWSGWGTALKPAAEDWWLVRKPLIGTVIQNVLEHGTGAINIDASRISTQDNLDGGAYAENPTPREAKDMWTRDRKGDTNAMKRGGAGDYQQPTGRWPANVTLEHAAECKFLGTEEGEGYAINRFTDGAKPFGHGAGHPYESEKVSETIERWECHEDCPVRMLDEQSGISKSTGGRNVNITPSGVYGGGKGLGTTSAHLSADEVRGDPGFGDVGGASRFFYTAKASKSERNAGLKGEENKHPTVKATALMEYLIKMITPPGGVVIDAFMGSGSTGVSAIKLGRSFVGIDQEKENVEVAKARITHAVKERTVELEGQAQRDAFDRAMAYLDD